jgi:hypothetical protein
MMSCESPRSNVDDDHIGPFSIATYTVENAFVKALEHASRGIVRKHGEPFGRGRAIPACLAHEPTHVPTHLPRLDIVHVIAMRKQVQNTISPHANVLHTDIETCSHISRNDCELN